MGSALSYSSNCLCNKTSSDDPLIVSVKKQRDIDDNGLVLGVNLIDSEVRAQPDTSTRRRTTALNASTSAKLVNYNNVMKSLSVKIRNSNALQQSQLYGNATQPILNNEIQLGVGVKTAKAIFDYRATGKGQDISFFKGDKFQVLDSHDQDWWYVRHLGTNKLGNVPANFIAEETSLESEDWFFGCMSRREAYKHLMAQGNPRGTFLIRISDRDACITLTVRNWDPDRKHHMRHYRVQSQDGNFFISVQKKFTSIQELIDFYSQDAQGLCHILIRACPKPNPQMWDISRQLKDKWEIDCVEVAKQKKIGQGNFGEVWKGTWNGREVAIKSMKQGSSMSKQAFLEEAAIMKKFRHDRLVSLYAVCTNNDHICIIQEFMCRGSLLEVLKNPEERENISLSDMVYIAEQVASGMHYLECQGLIHRDLAARNILMGDNYIAKIGDFGLARVLDDDEEYHSKGSKFPIRSSAPEIFKRNAFSIKSDVWSYGILLWEMFSFGERPYRGILNHAVQHHVANGFRLARPQFAPEHIYNNIMAACWSFNPQERPTFEYIKYYFEDTESFFSPFK